MENTDTWLTVKQVAETLSVHENSVRNWLANGHPKHGKIRHRYRRAWPEIPQEEVDRLLAEV